MKLTHKIISVILTLVLMAGLLIPVSAATITAGQAQSVTVVDDETPVVFQFIPTKSGHYIFYSYNSHGCDPSGYIMDADKELLADGDDTENGMDFSIACYLTAGQTYYLAATCYSGAGQYTVQIKELASPTSIAFDRDTYVGSIRGSAYPQIHFYPADCATEKVTLSSSNESVVQIIENEAFYFGIPGTATVTATSESGLTATCTVTVESPADLPLDTPWTLDASKGEQLLRFIAPADGWYGIRSEGDEIDPRVEVLDAALDGIVQDDESLPDDNFFAPFYLKAGQLCYFVFNMNNSITGTARVTLQELSSATGIDLPQDSITAYTDTLCWLLPVSVPRVSIPEELVWKSSNEDVVFVDQMGHVSFLEPGSAVITVTTQTGKSDSVQVTVLSAPTGSDLIARGICGPNLLWQLTSAGKLTITGSGDMYKLYDNDSHWSAYSDRIKQVVFPDGITGIGYGAFLSCTKLTEVSVPDSVVSIDSDAFSGCYSLTRITLPKKLDHLGQGVFDYCISLEQVTLPEGLKRLPNATFRSCISLSQLTLPQALISIGDEALSGCPIRAIELPSSLQTVGYSAFAGTGLTTVTLPEGLTELRDYAFVNCYLTELTVPATVTKLGSSFVTGNNLHILRFLGNAPVFNQYAFDDLVVTVYYPAANRTWTQDIRQNYNGTVNWVPEGDPGVTLVGTAMDGATLTLSQNGQIIETITVQNASYSIPKLLSGSYTLTAAAAKHVTRTYTVLVADRDLTQDIKLHLIGDVDGNGKVNIGDVAKINAHIKGSTLLTDPYILECANVNGGKLNIGDSASLYAHIRGTKKL